MPFREISLAPTKTMSGEIEVNEPVRVYDTSGPWGDSSPARTVTLDPVQGLPPLRRDWIRDAATSKKSTAGKFRPIDDGYLSEKHAHMERLPEHPNVELKRHGDRVQSGARCSAFSVSLCRKPLRAKSHPVTQLYYARQGVITPEMEFIAIRENLGCAQRSEDSRSEDEGNGRMPRLKRKAVS